MSRRPRQRGFRGTQPFRKAGGRQPGASLDAMLRGRPFYMPNPMTVPRKRRKRTLADRMMG